jgi:hypothetical protein
LGGCIQGCELSVIPNVEGLGSKLKDPALRAQRDPLGHRHVPVVDARLSQDADAGITKAANRRARERRMLKFSWNVGLERLGFPTTVILGAIAEPVIFAPSVVVKVGVKGAPVWNVDIPLMLQ